MEISTLLDDDRASKLAYIQQQTQQGVSEVMQAAIDLYYNQLQPTPQTPLETMQESGFVGCIKADPNLSTNYKALLRSVVQAKHDHR